MIDQDYSELLNREPPSGDVLEWTFATSLLAVGTASFLVGTPLVCLVLYYAMGTEDDRGGVALRVSS